MYTSNYLLLYGCKLLGLSLSANCKKIFSNKNRESLRVIPAYRTLSSEFVTSMIPIELLMNKIYQWWNAEQTGKRIASRQETQRKLQKI